MPPEIWLELTVRTRDESGLVCGLLMELAGGAVEERGGKLITYMPPPGDLREFLEGLTARLRALPSGAKADVSWRWQPHQDWGDLWRRGLGLRRDPLRGVAEEARLPNRYRHLARPRVRLAGLDPRGGPRRDHPFATSVTGGLTAGKAALPARHACGVPRLAG